MKYFRELNTLNKFSLIGIVIQYIAMILGFITGHREFLLFSISINLLVIISCLINLFQLNKKLRNLNQEGTKK